mgnify:CR=1 FL=1
MGSKNLEDWKTAVEDALEKLIPKNKKWLGNVG